MPRLGKIGAGGVGMLWPASTLWAGMPSALPIDMRYAWELTDSTRERLEAISFFLLAFFLSAVAFRWIWNALRGSFPRLPKLSLWRSLGFMVLWGLLFVVVLTMISGARELMTPGAWEKQGLTYRLADAPRPSAASFDERVEALENLKAELWQYADEHGHFPGSADEVGSSELWQFPGAPNLRLIYVPGERIDAENPYLVYEPDIEGQRRLALLRGGEIGYVDPDKFNAWLPR